MADCTDPLVNDECTVLLIHSNDDHNSFVFTDSGNGPNCPHALTRIGSAVHSQCFTKFCKSSLFFPPGPHGIETPDHTDFTFPGDFCYDFWFMSLTAGLSCLFGFGNAGLAGIGEISVNRVPNKLVYYYGGASILISTTLIQLGCFYHVAILRTGTDLRLHINGFIEAEVNSWGPTLDGTHFRLGISHANTIPFYGVIVEPRVSKGVPRWQSNFSPPLLPYSYLCEEIVAKLSGTVKEKGVGVQRVVKAYVRSTGAFYSLTTSLADGTFELAAPDDATDMFVVAFDDDPGTQYNALIYDRVKGILI